MFLAEIAPDLWTVTQPLRFLGLEVGSRMTIVRLPSKALVLISPIELKASDRPVLERLGRVAHIIAPNLFHHLSIGSAHTLFPEATVWGVAGLPQKRRDLTFDRILPPSGDFEAVLDFRAFQGFEAILPTGIKPIQETVFCHHPSGTLILTDTAFSFDETNRLTTRLAAQMLGSYKVLRPSRLEKWGSRDKATVAESVQHILRWSFDRVIPGHGSIVETQGKAQFKAGYEWFLERSLPDDDGVLGRATIDNTADCEGIEKKR